MLVHSRKTLTYIFSSVLCALCFAQITFAVPPPDFLFNLGGQVFYLFSFLAIFVSASFSVIYQFLRVKYHALKAHPWLPVIGVFLIFLASFSGFLAYENIQSKKAYQEWLVASEAHAQQKVQSTPKVKPEENVLDVLKEEAPSQPPESLPISITNEAFQAVLDGGTQNYVVLDAREDLEAEYGRFPGSIHIRYADLLAHKIDQLPKNDPIYVLCWSGMRGKIVAELLRSYGFTAIYLEDGSDGWVNDFHGLWEGEIKFSATYPDSKYGVTYGTDEVRAHVSDGVILVDAREPENIANQLPGSYLMPLMLTPSEELETMYSSIPANSKVVTVCDEYINCFIAKIVGVELEKRGHIFLGRYNRPWEY